MSELPAPLDAYITAKPEEPTFTLQGGDPLAAPLVRLWAYLARVRTGQRGDIAWIDTPIAAAKYSSIEEDKKKCEELLLRASQAEMMSWHMDGYRRGEINLETEHRQMTDLTKLDIYDIRRRCASAISGFFSELNDYREQLLERQFLTPEMDNVMQEAITTLRSVMNDIEIRKPTYDNPAERLAPSD